MAHIMAIAMYTKGGKKRDCEDRYTSIDAKITLDKSRPSVSGVWALSATVQGVDGKKRYKIRNM